MAIVALNIILLQCAAATASFSGGTAVTVIGDHDLVAFEIAAYQVTQMRAPSLSILQGNSQHLVEVAIIDMTSIVHADKLATHNAR